MTATQAAPGQPFDGRLETKPGAQTASYTVPDGKSFSLTDVVFENPEGDNGTLSLQRGDNKLLVVRLENFRDLDYHFVAPVLFTSGQKLVLQVACTNAAVDSCTPAAYFSGFLRNA